MEKFIECIQRLQENQSRLLGLLEEQGRTINEVIHEWKLQEERK